MQQHFRQLFGSALELRRKNGQSVLRLQLTASKCVGMGNTQLRRGLLQWRPCEHAAKLIQTYCTPYSCPSRVMRS